jgi:hypothetical protein
MMGLKITAGNELIPVFMTIVTTVNEAFENFSALSDQFWKLKDYAEQSVPALSLLMDAFLLFANPIQGVIELIEDFKRELVFLGIITPEAAGLVKDLGSSMDDVASSTETANGELQSAASLIASLHSKEVTVIINVQKNIMAATTMASGVEGGLVGGGATGGYMRAAGGYAGGSYLVGERGPEVVTPASQGYVAPNETATIKLDEGSMRSLSKYIVDGMSMARA